MTLESGRYACDHCSKPQLLDYIESTLTLSPQLPSCGRRKIGHGIIVYKNVLGPELGSASGAPGRRHLRRCGRM